MVEMERVKRFRLKRLRWTMLICRFSGKNKKFMRNIIKCHKIISLKKMVFTGLTW